MIIEKIANNVLSLSQEVGTNIKGFFVLDSLNFIDGPTKNIHSQSSGSSLLIRHVAIVDKTLNLSVNSLLIINQQTIPRAYDVSVNSWLLMVQNGFREPRSPLVRTQLALSHSVVVSKAKGTYSQLSLTQSVVFNITKNVSCSHTFTMFSQVVGYLPDYNWQNGTYILILP